MKTRARLKDAVIAITFFSIVSTFLIGCGGRNSSLTPTPLFADSLRQDILVARAPQSAQTQQYATPVKIDFCGEPMPLSDSDVFEKFELDFLSNVNSRTQTLLYLKRAGRFFPYIEQRLKEAGLPDDLKYLVVAESTLKNVVSPAGAAGFWQLMPAVSKSYGLVVTQEVDERYNLEKATTAAIRYLTEAKKKFGNWTAVAASYNMGMGGYQGELTFQGEESYYNLYLNDETSRYVFRIAAIKAVMTEPSKYGYEPVNPYKPIETREVSVKESIPNLAKWAKDNGTSYKSLRLLNPWLRSREMPAPPASVGSYILKLPKPDSTAAKG